MSDSSQVALFSPQPDPRPILALVLNGLTSPHSRRAYAKALSDFLAWHQERGRPPLSKALVQEYRAVLQQAGLEPATINQRICAIRKLAAEAADNGLLDSAQAAAIGRVKGIKTAGVRTGNWLTRQQAQRLLDAPDPSTRKGRRDRAVLAVLLGCGLRRAEAAGLTFEQIQMRDGRWAIVDLSGKGRRLRSVPMPAWCKAAIDDWSACLPAARGRVFRAVNKGDDLAGERRVRGGLQADGCMTPQGIFTVVKEYAYRCGFDLAAHDLRRTFAKLAHKGGAALEQIQLSLGHASLKTTERYLGVEQQFDDAPCDYLGLESR